MRDEIDANAKIRLVISLIIILLGGFLYCNLKSDTFINQYFDQFLLIKKYNHNNLFLFFIYNWGFDIIWVISFYLMLSVFCKHKYVLIITLFCAIAFEFLQLVFNRLGTFDILDLAFEIICIAVLFLFFIYFRKEG